MIDGQGLVTMLDAAGHTIASLHAQMADAERVRVEQEQTIAHLREELAAARTEP